ncbi:hypothetical protein GCM10009779_19190 [Polymorphospora rubra]|uniref:Uncharacterized protein n=1 Tax=Polymorphospora rubra TaxID=338584 RepID=A0A810MY10_9ACTN|nr:hypothetical protein Prubr_23950 [Polymorphospora rubra]
MAYDGRPAHAEKVRRLLRGQGLRAQRDGHRESLAQRGDHLAKHLVDLGREFGLAGRGRPRQVVGRRHGSVTARRLVRFHEVVNPGDPTCRVRQIRLRSGSNSSPEAMLAHGLI